MIKSLYTRLQERNKEITSHPNTNSRFDFINLKNSIPDWIEVLQFYEKNLDLLSLPLNEGEDMVKTADDSINAKQTKTYKEPYIPHLRQPVIVNTNQTEIPFSFHNSMKKPELNTKPFDPFSFSLNNENRGTYPVPSFDKNKSRTSLVQRSNHFFSESFNLKQSPQQTHKIYSENNIPSVVKRESKKVNKIFTKSNTIPVEKADEYKIEKIKPTENNLMSPAKKLENSQKDVYHFYTEDVINKNNFEKIEEEDDSMNNLIDKFTSKYCI